MDSPTLATLAGKRPHSWTAADRHFLAAGGLVVLFTAQRLTGYMSLFLYKRLPYDDLVLLAHFFGGAGLVAVCTIGASGAPMHLRSVPVLRALVSAGWLVGCVVVLLLWWICNPAWWPGAGAAQAAAMIAALGLVALLFRPVEKFVSSLPAARWWKIAAVVALWQAYSLDWELRLNFLKDAVTLSRRHVQWDHIALDLVATAAGLAWALWVQRKVAVGDFSFPGTPRSDGRNAPVVKLFGSTLLYRASLYRHWPEGWRRWLRWSRTRAYCRWHGMAFSREEANWVLARDAHRLVVPDTNLSGPALRALAERFDELFACPELAGHGGTIDASGPIHYCGGTVRCSVESLLDITCAVAAYNRHYPLAPGQTVVDAGAFEGMFAIYAACRVGASGRVIALEPDPENLRRLRENVARSGLNQIEIVEAGLWSRDGTVEFSSGGHGAAIAPGIGSTAIRVTTLAGLIERHKITRLDFVKMDIEGAEVEVLESSQDLLPTLHAAWAIASYHRRDGKPTARRLEEIFRASNYEVTTENPIHLTTFAHRRTPPSLSPSGS